MAFPVPVAPVAPSAHCAPFVFLAFRIVVALPASHVSFVASGFRVHAALLRGHAVLS